MQEPCAGTLLIVEDDPLKRTTLDIELKMAGYRVLQAPDSRTALHHLQEQTIDVVVTDWRMPEMDGMQLLNHIKERWPHVQVILMTAYSSVDSAVQAIKMGASDYLSKPFATADLLVRLKRLNGNGHDNGIPKVGAADSAADNAIPAAVTIEAAAADQPAGCLVGFKLPDAVAGVEKSLIDAALRQADGNQAKAAQLLGIPRTTLRDKLAKYGLASEHDRPEAS